jgi:hypothetical protein
MSILAVSSRIQLFDSRTLVLTIRSRRGVSIKATRDVEKSCSTSDMSSSEVELDSSKGSVLKMRRPRVVAASSQPE